MRRLVFILLIFMATGTYAQTDLSGLKFCLDPGHGNYPHDKPYETRINLRVANFLKSYLEEYGAWVIITRKDSIENPSLSQRDRIANNNNVDFFLSIHHNAFQGNANYTVMLYKERPNGQPEWPGQSDVMCGIMANYLHHFIYTTAGYVRGDLSFIGFNYGILRDLNMPGVLSEASFWDYVPEVHRLNSLGYLKLEAYALLYSYLEYYGAPKKPSTFVEGVVRDDDGNNLPGITVTITNGTDEMVYVTDSQDIGVTAQDNRWPGFPYTEEVRNGMFFFENFSPGYAKIILEGADFLSDSVNVFVRDTTSTRISAIKLISTRPPVVVSTTPAEGDTNFPAWDEIIINFSKKMNRASVEAGFVISPTKDGAISWADNYKKLKFRPDSLEFETNYKITIAGTAIDAYGYTFDGNADGTGGDDFELNFKTGPEDMVPPEIVSAYPPTGASNIESLPIVNITFNEQLNPSSLYEGVVRLAKYGSQVAVPGILQHYVVDDRSVLCFFPSEQLLLNQTYLTRINPGIKDLTGNEQLSAKAFRFRTVEHLYEISVIDSFETDVTSNWWSPQTSGNTIGIITDSTDISVNSDIVNLLTESNESLQLKYGWNTAASSWLIRMYLSGGSPKNVWFDNSYILQLYVFGDGSGNKFRFCVDDKVPNYAGENHEVSPWYTIDWIGWKLVTWDMMNDSSGTWIGDGSLDGTLGFDSIQLTYETGNSVSGTLYFDDLRLLKQLPVGVDQQQVASLPGTFTLYQNYPNPFNSGTTIRYRISSGQHHIVLSVYNVLGKKVRALINEETLAGEYLVQWDGKDDNGEDVTSGIYLYKLSADGYSHTRWMILVK